MYFWFGGGSLAFMLLRGLTRNFLVRGRGPFARGSPTSDVLASAYIDGVFVCSSFRWMQEGFTVEPLRNNSGATFQ